MVAEDKMAGIPVLIFANKQDLLSSKPAEVSYIIQNICFPLLSNQKVKKTNSLFSCCLLVQLLLLLLL